MESQFSYNTIAEGQNFLSRKRELAQFVSAIEEGRNVEISEPPKTGKASFVQYGFQTLKSRGFKFMVFEFDLMNIVSDVDLFNKAAEKLIPAQVDTDMFLESHYDSEVPKEALDCLFSLPEKIAVQKNMRVVVYFKEFQNILKFDRPSKILAALERNYQNGKEASFVFTGSGVNAMMSIFDRNKLNFNNRLPEKIAFLPLEEKSVTDLIIKVFLTVGRVIEQEQAERIYQTVNGHPWYIWHLSQIVYDLTKGYVNDCLIDEAIASLLVIHEVRFREIMSNLSNYQISYLRAIFDGNVKNSIMETIAKYRLNSVANVHRLKEALSKKEVISFDENNNPYILDPLFVLWLRRFYFK